ncbi:baseplate J/gp47 family protein [uncultured Cohaesibacter sp.]|uniref:baseplate J/gp47 family protein n=1 Tax=uncultured Cohaesibacter sp. TaxID=1002546 RepID=UPI0029C7E7E1|nr:baseplate J/gp47 family protein [uncultured Cohaesibacter sp.]
MSKFVSPDLSALGDLPLETVAFEDERSRRMALLAAAFAANDIDFDETAIEHNPVNRSVARAGAYNDIHILERINEAISKLSIVTDNGAALEHIAATYYGISRLTVTDEDGNQTDEDLESFRDRILLAPEAFSVAGPEGAYAFHALELDGEADVVDVAVYGHEDGAVYSAAMLFADAFTAGLREVAFDGREDGDPVMPSEVLIVPLPAIDYGATDQSLLDRVFAAVTAKDVRPIGDCVRIEAPEIVDYSVEMVLHYAPGADVEPLLDAVRAALETYVAKRRRVGVVAELFGIAGQGYITGVESVTLTSPVANVGGGRKQVPNCTAISVTAEQTEGRWDD